MDRTLTLLRAWSEGDKEAGDELFDRLYADLRAVAGQRLAAERSDRPMQTTELVHEAFLRLRPQAEVEWKERAHFFAIAATVMRRILVDEARRRLAEKRGAGAVAVTLETFDQTPTPETPDLVLQVHEALDELARLDPERARLVELRYFVGLSGAETAEILGQSRATVNRRWRVTKGWLHRRLTAAASLAKEPS